MDTTQSSGLRNKPWSNGKVGTWGPSALGKAQFDTAMERPPHLVCAVPLIAAMGITFDQYYVGGVLRDHHTRTLDLLGFGVRELVRAQSDPDALAWRLAERATVRPEAIDVPMLLITGWYDHYPSAVLRTFEDLRTRGGPNAREHVRLLVGPWDHMSVDLVPQGDREYPVAEGAALEAARAFFDYWLRDVGEEPMAQADVRYFRMGEARWVDGDEFPGFRVEPRSLYLAAAPAGGVANSSQAFGGLLADRPRQEERLVLEVDRDHPTPTLGGANLPLLPHGPTDHRELLVRDDVLVFSTGPVDEPLCLAGSATLDLCITSAGETADVAVRLLERAPDGTAWWFADSIVRCEPHPSRPTKVAIPTEPLALTIRAGHELVLVLSGTNAPRFELPPPTGARTLEVVLGGRSPARLELPLVAR